MTTTGAEEYEPDNMAFLAHAHGIAHTDCWCARCEGEAKADLYWKGRLSLLERLSSFMHLCPDCGNKRCPRASDHRNGCREKGGTYVDSRGSRDIAKESLP